MGDRHTLVHQLADWAEKKASEPALYGRDDSGTWQSLTWAEYWQRARGAAKGLMKLGHEPKQAVGIVGLNRPEWVISQFGAMAAGGMPAPVYPTSTKEQASHILKNSGAKILIVDGVEQLDKYLGWKAEGVVSIDKIVTMDEVPDRGEDVMSLDDLIKIGHSEGDDNALDERLAAIEPNDTGLFIYTSGTTGVPKGAQLSHRGLVTIGESLSHDYPELQKFQFRCVSYLPLSHIAEQIFTNFLHLSQGGEVYFCSDLTQIKAALLDARPTVFVGVPRVWEKFEAALRAKLDAATGVKAKLASWARKTELAAFEESVRTDRDVDTFSRRMANKLVVSKIKDALGLNNLVLAASGAAPISRATLDFFASIGIPVHEGYGMTETTGLVTASPFMRPRFGSVGVALHGVELKIAEDGEICARGENMTKGYYQMPEETAELIDEDGWLHTGDLGQLDKDGFLSITGRKKDLLITAGGKNVAPAEMEGHLVTLPGVAQAVVVGDRKPYLCALLALDAENVASLCSAAGLAEAPISDLMNDAKLKTYIEKRIETECNAKVARYQTIKKFRVLPEPFTVEGGELTPSMKVRRNVVNDKYQSVIEEMYAE